MYSQGRVKASELIALLQKKIEQHGDQYVFSGGEDYPGPVTGVGFERIGNSYVPQGTFRIYGGI